MFSRAGEREHRPPNVRRAFIVRRAQCNRHAGARLGGIGELTARLPINEREIYREVGVRRVTAFTALADVEVARAVEEKVSSLSSAASSFRREIDA